MIKKFSKYYEGCIIHEVEFLKLRGQCKEATLSTCIWIDSKDIPDFLVDNVDEVVKKCEGLPLTLEVIGTYLRDHGANAQVWKETLRRLRETRAITGDKKDSFAHHFL